MKKITIIGGGLGGMSAAISLAKNKDFMITLIEKNSHLGGKLNVKKMDGFTFDLGPSIFTMPHYFDKLFSIHNKNRKDYFELVPVSPHWRNFFEDGKIIDLKDSLEKMKNEKSISRKDFEELKKFYTYSEKLYTFTNEVLFKNQSENFIQTMQHYPIHKIIPDSDYFKTMDEGIKQYISNPYLIDILNYFIKYVGSSPFDSPAVLNLLPFIQWKFGLWYVKGGMFEASKGLTKLIEELPNIKVVLESEVDSVNYIKKEIKSVFLKDKTEILTDILVSNMEAIPFYKYILKLKEKKYKRLLKYGPACSGFALHLGVKKIYPQLAHHNFFFSKDLRKNFECIFHNHELHDDPTIYLVAPMKTDPNQGPDGHEIIKILPHISVIDPKKPFTSEEYNNFENYILDKLERMGLKDLRENIVSRELWTPEKIQQTYYSNQGSIYGVEANRKKNLGFKIPKKSHLFNNLFFVGGTTNPGGGMPMVVLSGQQVAEQIIKKLNK